MSELKFVDGTEEYRKAFEQLEGYSCMFELDSITVMDVELLKAIANNMGYKLVRKVPPIPKLVPCSCGRKNPEIWRLMYAGSTLYKCPKCGLKSKPGKTKREARENWIKAVEESKEEK